VENVKAVILDLDNTIGNRHDYVYRMYKEMLLISQPSLQDDPLELEAILQQLYSWDETGGASKKEVFSKLEEKLGIKINVNQDYTKYWAENFGRFYSNYPYSVDTIKYLASKYKLGLITNGFTNSQSEKIARSGLKDYFKSILISDELGIAKPSKEIFHLSCQQLEVQPSEAVYVGDCFYIDIIGALKAGLKAIWVCDNKYRACDYDITRIETIDQLKNIL